MSRSIALAVLLLPALVLALALPSRGEAAAAPPGFFGVNINAGPVDYEAMAAANTGVTRMIFPANAFKPTREDGYRWTYGDQIVRSAATRGIDVIPILYGLPHWISDKLNKTPLKGKAKKAWDEYVAVVVSRYGPGGTFWDLKINQYVPYNPIEVWQIWNEPNSITWWGPKPNAREYGSFLKATANVIHAIDPRAEVMTAGIVAEPTNSHAITGKKYLGQLFKDRGVAKVIDDVAYHPYAGTVAGVKKQLKGARSILNRRRARNTPIWVTEIGWGSKRGRSNHPLIKSKAGQKAALRGSFKMALQMRKRLKLHGMLWYQWRDGRDDLCLWCESSGLVDKKGAAKDLLDVFASLSTP